MYKTFITLVLLTSAANAAGGFTPMVDENGKPSEKVLLRSSISCHMHNADEASAKINCAPFDNQIIQRATEPAASQAIKDRAKELQ